MSKKEAKFPIVHAKTLQGFEKWEQRVYSYLFTLAEGICISGRSERYLWPHGLYVYTVSYI